MIQFELNFHQVSSFQNVLPDVRVSSDECSSDRGWKKKHNISRSCHNGYVITSGDGGGGGSGWW